MRKYTQAILWPLCSKFKKAFMYLLVPLKLNLKSLRVFVSFVRFFHQTLHCVVHYDNNTLDKDERHNLLSNIIIFFLSWRDLGLLRSSFSLGSTQILDTYIQTGSLVPMVTENQVCV